MSGRENLVMADGSNAVFQVFEAGQPRAVIMAVHGFAEYIGRYARMAHFFNNNGISVCTYDQRGFGECALDKKRGRGVGESYAQFLDDADTVYDTISRRYSGLPVILFGHSMGGNISISYLLSRPQSRFCAAILETPWLRLHADMDKRVLSLAGTLGLINNGIATKEHTKGIYRIKGIRSEKRAQHAGHTFDMITSIADTGEGIIGRAAEITLPALLLSAGKDHLVSTLAIEEFYSHAGANMQYMHIEGGRHALHTDRHNSGTVFNAMLGFIDAHIGAYKPEGELQGEGEQHGSDGDTVLV